MVPPLSVFDGSYILWGKCIKGLNIISKSLRVEKGSKFRRNYPICVSGLSSPLTIRIIRYLHCVSPANLQVRVILRIQNSLLWLEVAVENNDEDVGGSNAGDCTVIVKNKCKLK